MPSTAFINSFNPLNNPMRYYIYYQFTGEVTEQISRTKSHRSYMGLEHRQPGSPVLALSCSKVPSPATYHHYH